MVICLLLAIVRFPEPVVSLVIVDPAAINEPCAIITGATNIEPEPINESSFIIVLFLLIPS